MEVSLTSSSLAIGMPLEQVRKLVAGASNSLVSLTFARRSDVADAEIAFSVQLVRCVIVHNCVCLCVCACVRACVFMFALVRVSELDC